MKNRFYPVVPAICMALSLTFPLSAQAKTMCGEKTHMKFGETRIYARNYIGTCRPDGSCAAVTYKLNAGTKKRDAPLGWDHRLTITRKTSDAPWRIVLTAVSVIPDISEGISMKTDSDDADAVPYEFLRPEQAINELSIDTKLSDIFITKFKAGNNVRWSYTVKNSGDKASTVFSLVGLTRTMKWLGCMEKKR